MTTKFEAKKFSFPALKGISEKTMEEHMKLYTGYVNNANLILQKLEELSQDSEKNAYALGEVNRRFGFEFNGIRNHEVYFSLLEKSENETGSITRGTDSKILGEVAPKLKLAIEKEWGSFDAWLIRFKAIALTRGIGWAMLYKDNKTGNLLNAWVDEQHLGQLQDCTLVFCIDMWEHSFVADYAPSGKKNYVNDFLENVNWKKAEELFTGEQFV